MSRRTNDQLADEITEALDGYIVEYWRDTTGEGITWKYAGTEQRMWIRTEQFRDLVRRQYFPMEGRGLKPSVLNQVVLNIEAKVRFGRRLKQVSASSEDQS